MKIILSILLLLCIGSCKEQSIERLKLPQKISSIVFTEYSETGYNNPHSNDRYFNLLKESKSNVASFLYTCYAENAQSNLINCNTQKTPGIKSLEKLILRAKLEHLPVNFRFYIDMKDGTWRCKWKPSQKDKAFNSLTKIYTNMAKYLEALKVEMWTIGAELCLVTGQDYYKEWKLITNEIRKVYKGKLIYAPNYTKGFEEYKATVILPLVDIIGIDYYPSYKTESYPSTYELRQFHRNTLNYYLKDISRYNKPIFVSEVGIGVEENAYQRPYDWTLQGPVDVKRKNQWIDSTLNLFKNFDLLGYSIWRYQGLDFTTKKIQGFYLLDPSTIKTLSKYGHAK